LKQIVSFFGSQNEEIVRLNDEARSYAENLGLAYTWVPMQPFDKELAIKEMKTADAAIIDVDPFDESIFREIAARTKLLIRFGVGYDAVDLEAASRHGIAVARTPGANSSGVAELALTLALAVKRRVVNHQIMLVEGKWQKHMGSELSGAIVGIVGFGAVGQKLAKYLAGFDCRLLAYDPYPDEQQAETLNVQFTSLEALFESSDLISLHLPYNRTTDKIVNRGMIGRMKNSAVIVNTSRGGVVDEEALFDALNNKRIGGAGLDVFTVEPIGPDHPIVGLDNVVLTPHIASFTHESLWGTYKMALDTAADFFNGKTCSNIINKDFIDE
jgi:D-3-phosphoglycerate dehydrogenase